MKGERVLIVGGGGLVGRHLTSRLLAEGMNVTATTRHRTIPKRLEELADSLSIQTLDLTNREETIDVVKTLEPGYVFNLVSTTFNPPPQSSSEHFSVNVVGLTNLMEAMHAIEDARLVFTGSAAAYGSGRDLKETCPDRPENHLGLSKAATSVLIRNAAQVFGLHAVELRLFTPFGPFEAPHRFIPSVILAALTGTPRSFSDGRQRRDFVFIDVVVDAMVLSIQKEMDSGSILNISTRMSRTIRSVSEEILSQMKAEISPKWGELPVRSDEIWDLSGPYDTAKAVLGWSPKTTLEEGLQMTIDWFRSNLDLATSLGHGTSK